MRRACRSPPSRPRAERATRRTRRRRWTQEGYVEILAAERGEQVRAEPFEATPLQVGVLFGDDEDDEPVREPQDLPGPSRS